MVAVKTQHDYIFDIAQEIRENNLRKWNEKRKEQYWIETARLCEELGIEKDFIREIKKTLSSPHTKVWGLFGFLDASKFLSNGICCTAICNRKQIACAQRALSLKAGVIRSTLTYQIQILKKLWEIPRYSRTD